MRIAVLMFCRLLGKIFVASITFVLFDSLTRTLNVAKQPLNLKANEKLSLLHRQQSHAIIVTIIICYVYVNLRGRVSERKKPLGAEKTVNKFNLQMGSSRGWNPCDCYGRRVLSTLRKPFSP